MVTLLGTAAPGCNLIVSATRNACNEPCRLATECKEHIGHRALANRAWAEIQQKSPDITVSKHYVEGFKAGFTSYLWAGGSGSPPILPPRHYWKFRYESADGYRDIQDWFDGYRHGSAAAEESGLRETVIIPTSLTQRTDVDPEHEEPHDPHENGAALPMPRITGKPSSLPAPQTSEESKDP